MRVRIVNYELGKDSWILKKFADKIHENLQEMGISSDIDSIPDPLADINHHIIYIDYDGIKRGIDTLMITHIDTSEKLERLKAQMQSAAAGICMSAETVNVLTQLGVNKNGLCYINPATDGKFAVRKIIVGFSSRAYDDGRKREFFLEKLADKLDPRLFRFRIMGANWDTQVTYMRNKGFEVDYFNEFDYDQYLEFIPSLEYYLYMGLDEGQMGFVDALAAGVKTIVTTQGFHLDAPNGITHGFTSYEELENIFMGLQQEKNTLLESVATWNWSDYSRKHVEIWKFLLDNRNDHSVFNDGLNSLLQSRNNQRATDVAFATAKNRELKRNLYKQLYTKNKYQFRDRFNNSGISGVLKLIMKKIAYRLK